MTMFMTINGMTANTLSILCAGCCVDYSKVVYCKLEIVRTVARPRISRSGGEQENLPLVKTVKCYQVQQVFSFELK